MTMVSSYGVIVVRGHSIRMFKYGQAVWLFLADIMSIIKGVDISPPSRAGIEAAIKVSPLRQDVGSRISTYSYFIKEKGADRKFGHSAALTIHIDAVRYALLETALGTLEAEQFTKELEDALSWHVWREPSPEKTENDRIDFLYRRNSELTRQVSDLIHRLALLEKRMAIPSAPARPSDSDTSAEILRAASLLYAKGKRLQEQGL